MKTGWKKKSICTVIISSNLADNSHIFFSLFKRTFKTSRQSGSPFCTELILFPESDGIPGCHPNMSSADDMTGHDKALSSLCKNGISWWPADCLTKNTDKLHGLTCSLCGWILAIKTSWVQLWISLNWDIQLTTQVGVMGWSLTQIFQG